MHRLSPRLFAMLVAFAAQAALSASAEPIAEPPPTGTITWVVGFPPGGTVDTLTRAAAQELSRRTSRPVVVENRAGAFGSIAAREVARSKPDGTTLITVPGPILSSQPFPEIGGELTAVIGLGVGPMVLVGPASKALPTLADVIASARKRPSDWSFATSGVGTSQHLAGELLNQVAGTRMLHVPYKGGSAAVNDVLGGQVPLGMLGSAAVIPHIRSGGLKAYAVTSAQRIAALPDVPTIAEAGYPGYDATQWFFLAAPAGTPAPVLQWLNANMREVEATPSYLKVVEAAGMTPLADSPEQSQRFVTQDMRKWRDLVKKAGLKLE